MEEKKKFSLPTVDRVILIVVLILSLAATVLTVLRRAGLELINGALLLYLPALAVMLLVGWGVYALVRRIKRRPIRLALIVTFAILGILVFSLVISFIGYMASVNLPRRYKTIEAPSGGQKLVVLRGYEVYDDEHIATRHAAHQEADPEIGEDLVAEDWGYVYTAYPQALGVFYRSNADVEGAVHLGYGSAATMMMEWQDDGKTARFFVQDPEPGDDGECIVHLP